MIAGHSGNFVSTAAEGVDRGEVGLESSRSRQARPKDTGLFVDGQAIGRPTLPRVLVTPEGPGVLCDVAFLCLIYFLSAGLYVTHLGFYSDDWAHMAVLEVRGDLSGYSVIEYLMENSVSPRPVHYLWLAALHKMFGVAPLGYHLANSAVLLSNTLLFYFCLREFRLPRQIIVAVPAFYTTLPNYSTVHFWIATFY
jgi:hypothetical protein